MADGGDGTICERLYEAAERGEAEIPWARGAPHPLLAEWLDATTPEGGGRRAVVVGCGLGDDAELLAARGFDTLAFDLAPTAIRIARRRFPASRVRYRTADVLALPEDWRRAYDLVVEVLTVQSLAPHVQARATASIAGLVAPAGTLLAIASIQPGDAPVAHGPPWPLTRAGIERFAGAGLDVVGLEDVAAPGLPGQRRWRAELRRPAA